MREILFRGKRVDNGEWVTGYPIFYTNGTAVICNEYQPNHNVIHETVGQFTGLTDNNGKKIFEGDILDVHDNWEREDFIGVVDFDNASFMIADGFVSHYRWMDYECEVIGNRWDNPELLEKWD